VVPVRVGPLAAPQVRQRHRRPRPLLHRRHARVAAAAVVANPNLSAEEPRGHAAEIDLSALRLNIASQEQTPHRQISVKTQLNLTRLKLTCRPVGRLLRCGDAAEEDLACALMTAAIAAGTSPPAYLSSPAPLGLWAKTNPLAWPRRHLRLSSSRHEPDGAQVNLSQNAPRQRGRHRTWRTRVV
jgi:hypothetical protein